MICDQITLKYNPVNNEYNGQTQIKTNYNPDNFFDGNYDSDAIQYSKIRIIELMAGTIAGGFRTDNISKEQLITEFKLNPANADDREKAFEFGSVLYEKEGITDIFIFFDESYNLVKKHEKQIIKLGNYLFEKIQKTPNRDIIYINKYYSFKVKLFIFLAKIKLIK